LLYLTIPLVLIARPFQAHSGLLVSMTVLLAKELEIGKLFQGSTGEEPGGRPPRRPGVSKVPAQDKEKSPIPMATSGPDIV